VKNLKDVQSEKDTRNIPLKKVGVSDLSWPIKVLDRKKGYQYTVAEMKISVDLKHDIRGTHMSRFIEALGNLEMVSPKALEKALDNLKKSLEAEVSHIEMEFPYFIWKESPKSKKLSPMRVDCKILAEKKDEFSLIIGVKVPIHTLCPCSKEISDFGAHNQRAYVDIMVKSRKLIWFESLVEIAEKSASSPVYTLLKRTDEKFVTESAFMNPKFVEDVARDVAIVLERDDRIEWYRVEVVSMESIHNHNTFACIEKGWVNASEVDE